jgi:spore coat protein CotH
VYVRFGVNGSENFLRLVIENPDDTWMAKNFDITGALYKAESTGDYSYRGDDP